MEAWLEHAECQLQAVDQVFFAVCVGVFKLLLLRFSGVIEPFNAEGCLVDDCCPSSNRLGFIN